MPHPALPSPASVLMNTLLANASGAIASAITGGTVAPFTQVPFVFLKQFRHVKIDGEADFQSIVMAKMKVTPTAIPAILADDFLVHLPHYDSVRIEANLGIAQPVDPSLAFRVQMEAAILPGQVLWP